MEKITREILLKNDFEEDDNPNIAFRKYRKFGPNNTWLIMVQQEYTYKGFASKLYYRIDCWSGTETKILKRYSAYIEFLDELNAAIKEVDIDFKIKGGT